MLYEIPPELNPRLPSQDLSTKSDSNNGISEDWTKTVTYMMMGQKNQYSSYMSIKTNNIPRIIWINKRWTLKQVHQEVFRFFRFSLSQLFANDKRPFKKISIDENENGKQLIKIEYEELSNEDAF